MPIRAKINLNLPSALWTAQQSAALALQCCRIDQDENERWLGHRR
jgi:hypothetical protein